MLWLCWICLPLFLWVQVALEAQGATLEVKVLSVMEFSSDRKRMSVLAQLPGGKLRLYTKVTR
jgi:magnesium-transporting ATPase (P-type)